MVSSLKSLSGLLTGSKEVDRREGRGRGVVGGVVRRKGESQEKDAGAGRGLDEKVCNRLNFL